MAAAPHVPPSSPAVSPCRTRRREPARSKRPFASGSPSSRLSTQRFLTVAAAEPTGDPIVVWRAASALGIAPADATPAVDAGLINIGVRVAFRHPLVRTASYGAAPLSDRQAAHRALADATDPDLDPDRRAWHRARSGRPDPTRTSPRHSERSAGRARARGGLAATAALLERSVALTVVPSRRARSNARVPRRRTWKPDRSSARAVCSAAAEATPLDDMDRAQLDLLRARHAIFRGDRRAGAVLMLRAAQRLESLDLNLAFATHLRGDGSRGDRRARRRRHASRRGAARPSPARDRPSRPSSNRLPSDSPPQLSTGHVVAAPLLRTVRVGTLATTSAGTRSSGSATRRRRRRCCGTSARRQSVDRAGGTGARRRRAVDARRTRSTRWPGSFLFEGDLDAAASAVSEATEILSATGSDFVTPPEPIMPRLEAADDAAQRIDE